MSRTYKVNLLKQPALKNRMKSKTRSAWARRKLFNHPSERSHTFLQSVGHVGGLWKRVPSVSEPM